jgi:sec-independent protein translocase protein TatA
VGELFTPTHLGVVAVIAFFVFGGRKLPELGKGLGEGIRGFKTGIMGIKDELNQTTTIAEPPETTETKG